MPRISLCFAQADEATASRIEAALKERGATVLLEPAPDRKRRESQRADGVAARTKASHAVGVIAGADAEAERHARWALRAALAYDRPLMVGRTPGGADLSDLARDDDIRAGTSYERRPAEAAEKASRGMDLEPAGDARDPGAPGALLGTVSPKAQPADRFADALMDLAEREELLRHAARESDDGEDTPKAATALLSRWRLVEARRQIWELERFLEEHIEDPYFAYRAASLLRLRKREFASSMGRWGYHGTMALLLVAGLVWTGAMICRDGACAPQQPDSFAAALGVEDLTAPSPAAAGAAPGAPLAAADVSATQAPAVDRLGEANRRLRGAIEKAAIMNASLQERAKAAEQERDRLRRRLDQTAREAARSGADADGRFAAAQAEANAAQTSLNARLEALTDQRDALEARLTRAEAENKRLQDALDAARSRPSQPASGESGRSVAAAAIAPPSPSTERGPKGAARIQELEQALSTLRQTVRRRNARIARLEAEAAFKRAAAPEPKTAPRTAPRTAPPPRARPQPRPADAAPRRAAAQPSRAQASRAQASRAQASRAQASRAQASRAQASRAQPRTPPENASTAIADLAPPRAAPPRPSRSEPAARPRDFIAAERVLRVMRREIDAAYRARSPHSAPRSVAPQTRLRNLSPAGVAMLQRCLIRFSGEPPAADGVWGRRTTAALMGVDDRASRRVAGCLAGRLRFSAARR